MALRGERAIEPESEWVGLRPGAADSAIAEAMQQRIVATAERLFRQYGYQKTTVADIAADLGMSPANVYRFFASKAAITEAVARKVTTVVVEQVRLASEEPGLSACDRLRRMVVAMQRAVTQQCLQDNRMHTMVQAAIEQNWNVIQAHKENLRRLIARVVAEGVAAGEFAAVEDVDVAAQCFQAATISCCHPMIIEHRLRSGDDIDATVAPMIEFALRGLGAREPG
ncbi:MAG TPA: TetR family transcriptional regulator [Amaricoccus sp.]|nr:TetR family transcriptional regulator [Amaricoccus sp.]